MHNCRIALLQLQELTFVQAENQTKCLLSELLSKSSTAVPFNVKKSAYVGSDGVCIVMGAGGAAIKPPNSSSTKTRTGVPVDKMPRQLNS